jgi:type IV secretion system protein VirB6
MNAAACQRAMEGVGSGVAASLRAVDCASSQMAQAAFGRLFGSGGALVPALTILLTLFVALFAFALITGRSRIGISSLTPRIVTLGLVLTFATSWIAYQSVVWNLAVGAPDYLAGILMGTDHSATQLFANKIDVVIAALEHSSGDGMAPSSTFSPLGLMWLGGILLLLGTVGVLATAKIALAILIAIGPICATLALFPTTRGLFTGWLKGVVLLALAPLFAVLGGSLMLELAVPVLSSLAPALPGQIDPQAAMAFFMIGTVHVALMILVMKVAATMVAGWSVFGLAGGTASARSETTTAGPSRVAFAPSAAAVAVDQARGAAPAPSRQIRMASPAPANDHGGATVRRETRIVGGASGHAAPTSTQFLSRARGVGSRFRAAPARVFRRR